MSDRARQSTGWQVEQSAAEAYEQYFVPIIFAPWAERLIDRSAVRDGERILDVACGTGIVARRAAERLHDGGSVVGLDINERMLAVAEETAVEEELPIEWRQGDAMDLPFADEHFDVAFCQQALQFFDQPATALAEMRRVLAPGGRAVLSVWRPLRYQSGYDVLPEALEQHFDAEAGDMMRSPFPDWTLPDVHRLVADGGFDDQTVTIETGSVRYPSATEFVRRELASSPLAAKLADSEVREPLVRDIEKELREYTDDKGINFPVGSYVIATQR